MFVVFHDSHGTEVHMSKTASSSPERRSFLTRFNAGAAAIAALAVSGVARAQVKPAPATRFEPARHDKDDWMDQIPGKHRLVIDTTTLDGFRDGVLFAQSGNTGRSRWPCGSGRPGRG